MAPVQVLQMRPVQVIQMNPVQVLQMSPVQVLQVQSSPAFTTCRSRYRKIPPAAVANQIAGKARILPAHERKKNKLEYLLI